MRFESRSAKIKIKLAETALAPPYGLQFLDHVILHLNHGNKLVTFKLFFIIEVALRIGAFQVKTNLLSFLYYLSVVRVDMPDNVDVRERFLTSNPAKTILLPALQVGALSGKCWL